MQSWYSFHWFSPALWEQFRFAYPIALFLIPAVLLLFVLRYYLHQRSQQRLNLSVGQLTVGPMQPVKRSTVRTGVTQSLLVSLRYLLPISVFLGVSLVLVALARPQLVRELRNEQSEGIDIMLAMDISASMSEADLPPSRLVVARRVAQQFINGLQNDRVGLVIFAGDAFSLCPLTTDYTLVKQYLDDLNERMIRTSGTAIGDALARCINRMREPARPTSDTTQIGESAAVKKRNKIIILLSDGDNTAGNLDPVTAARLAKAFDIRIYSIAVGRPGFSASGAATSTLR